MNKKQFHYLHEINGKFNSNEKKQLQKARKTTNNLEANTQKINLFDLIIATDFMADYLVNSVRECLAFV